MQLAEMYNVSGFLAASVKAKQLIIRAHNLSKYVAHTHDVQTGETDHDIDLHTRANDWVMCTAVHHELSFTWQVY